EIESTCAHLASLREAFVEGLARIPGARVVGGDRAASTVGAIAAIIVDGAPSEVRMHHLEELGVIVSAGSACHSHKSEASPSMTAMGLSAEEARSMLRFSFSRDTTRDDVARGLEALETVCRKLASARR